MSKTPDESIDVPAAPVIVIRIPIRVVGVSMVPVDLAAWRIKTQETMRQQFGRPDLEVVIETV